MYSLLLCFVLVRLFERCQNLVGLENSSWNALEWRKKSAPSWTLAGTEESFGVCVWNAMFFLFVFVLFDLLGVPLKSAILVFLFLFVLSLSQTCAEHARAAPTHNGLKCK